MFPNHPFLQSLLAFLEQSHSLPVLFTLPFQGPSSFALALGLAEGKKKTPTPTPLSLLWAPRLLADSTFPLQECLEGHPFHIPSPSQSLPYTAGQSHIYHCLPWGREHLYLFRAQLQMVQVTTWELRLHLVLLGRHHPSFPARGRIQPFQFPIFEQFWLLPAHYFSRLKKIPYSWFFCRMKIIVKSYAKGIVSFPWSL